MLSEALGNSEVASQPEALDFYANLYHVSNMVHKIMVQGILGQCF